MSEASAYVGSKGWTFSDSGGEIRIECPFCHATDERSMSINTTTGAWCCHRGKCSERGKTLFSLRTRLGDTPSVRPIERKKYKPPPPAKLTDLSDRAYEWFENRKIPREVVDRCKVRQQDNQLVFEYSDGHEIVNRQYRRQPKGFYNDKECRPILWGIDHVPRESRELIITEGMIDAMSVMVWGVDHVVSMPNGAENFKWIDESWDFLERYDSYFLLTDEDEPGNEAAEEISRRLPNCRRVRLGKKDANEALVAGMTAEQFADRYSHAEWLDAGLVKPAEAYEEELLKPIPPGESIGIPLMDKAFDGGVQRPSVNLVAGRPGHGKSTMILQIIGDSLESDHPIPTLVSSNEIPVVESINIMIHQSRRIPGSRAGNRDWFDTSARGTLYFLDLVSVVNEDEMFQCFETAARRHGIKTFVIDSVSRIDLSEGRDQYAREKAFINRTVQLAHKYGAIVWMVAHCRKPTSQQDAYAPVSLVDVLGTGHFGNLTTNAFIFKRCRPVKPGDDLTDEQIRKLPTNYIEIVKNRKSGRLWSAALRFDGTWKRFDQVDKSSGSI